MKSSDKFLKPRRTLKRADRQQEALALAVVLVLVFVAFAWPWLAQMIGGAL